MLMRRLSLYRNKSIIIAPRGEFSPGALQHKAYKKNLYINVIKFFRLYRDLIWQASSSREKDDILRILSMTAKKIMVAPDLVREPSVTKGLLKVIHCDKKEPRTLRLIFLSRISRKKNLDYLLRLLGKTKHLIHLSIYGTKEDPIYWAECQALVSNLPSFVTVEFLGEVKPEDVPKVFAKNDVFVFPTLGENFGHVIYESLAVGTSVIISDQTFWQADTYGAVKVLSLEEHDAWMREIESFVILKDNQFLAQREAALNYARKYSTSNLSLQSNRVLFRTALLEK